MIPSTIPPNACPRIAKNDLALECAVRRMSRTCCRAVSDGPDFGLILASLKGYNGQDNLGWQFN